jgi:hypothetical protein
VASFERRPEEWNRLDYRLLRDSPVTLYYRRSVLEEDLRWLESEKYEIYRLDADRWTTVEAFHDAASNVLRFPDYYGRNLDAFNDCLSDVEIPEAGGAALAFLGFDRFAARFPEAAWTVCDILAHRSRQALLYGRRLLALVQSDDPRIRFDVVGATPVGWNPREWSNATRGL